MNRKEYAELAARANASGKIVVNGKIVSPPEKPLSELREEAKEQLWSNYKTHQQKYVDGEDLTLATLCAMHGSTKGAAVQAWVMNLWREYYQVKDALEAAADAESLRALNLAPATSNVPPYTIRELNEEAAAFVATSI